MRTDTCCRREPLVTFGYTICGAPVEVRGKISSEITIDTLEYTIYWLALVLKSQELIREISFGVSCSPSPSRSI
jgi:hypothetical protein